MKHQNRQSPASRIAQLEKELEIEAALERVRARTMAMQHSEELPETSALLFQQVKALGEMAIQNSIAIVNEETGFVELSTTVHGSHVLHTLNVPTDDPFLMAKAVAAWKAKQKSLTVQFEGQELKNYNELRNSFLETKINFPENRWVVYISFFSKGWLSFSFDKNISNEIIDAQKRFAAVFDQTYTRFLDLQRAEAQSREAQIELALERVRARTMSMQKSDDLSHAVAIIFEEMDKLNLGMLRCGIGILDKEKCSANVWTTTKSESETVVQVSGDEPMNIHPLLQHAFDVWANQDEDGNYVLQGEDLNDFYKALTGTNFKLPGSQSIVTDAADYKQYYYVATFQSGNLYAFRDTAFTAEAKTIIKRFANVFDFTYTRFNDLKQAEQQLREAIKQASLDRVRGEIASMRITADLERITPLIWNELSTLGVPFIRCGVFIVDERAELIHTYLATPDGKALAVFDLPFDSGGIDRHVLPAWRKKQFAAIHWTEDEFAAFTKNLVAGGVVASEERYVKEHPNTSLDLHFLPFFQGMLYVGNITPLTEDEIDLVQSLADAFSTAYSRYEDFNKLELAKQQVENTLTHLRAAQTQLVQSEKMASLGELTAGIAHEIQNPLNFVNNFSDVNREMIDELIEELKAGNMDEALAITADIKQNEEKINHHGKRADSIVKGMLQHSRTSGGEKQATNINALADEFMRLSYHGLRAKDKTFNAEMLTDFDRELPKIEVVGQDIGRVFLNLFNNAFYAVGLRQKTAGASYRPQISVSTSSGDGHVIIRVKDNGVGIPEDIKNKIMQPFFTTKPTGEGTGLGLSLTYDMVVKGHGGSIEVNSVEGESSEFIITLPSL